MPRGTPRSTQAQHNPVIAPSGVDSQDVAIEQRPARVQDDTGLHGESIIARVHDIDMGSEKMQMLAFMNELVTVRIGTTTDKNAAQIFEINVNNDLQLFRRGEVKTVRRYIADRMARLKETTYTQQETVNGEGIKQILNIPHTGLKYDFSIAQDANPIGADWFRAVLAEPG